MRRKYKEIINKKDTGVLGGLSHSIFLGSSDLKYMFQIYLILFPSLVSLSPPPSSSSLYAHAVLELRRPPASPALVPELHVAIVHPRRCPGPTAILRRLTSHHHCRVGCPGSSSTFASEHAPSPATPEP